MIESIVKTIKFPAEIAVKLTGENTVSLKGPKGELAREFKTHRIKMTMKGNDIILEGAPKNKQTDKLVETIVSHLSNMSEGLMNGYKYDLKVVYSHFPMSIAVDKAQVNIKNFLGEKFARVSRIRGNTKVEVKGQDITVSGNNKEDVGQTASNLERKTKVRNKDIRRYQDGIYVTERGNISEQKSKPITVIRGRE